MEAIAEFDVDFARVVPVESSEGNAVIEFDTAVGYVHGVQRSGKALAEIFADGKIEGGVLRQIGAGIRLAWESVAEAGAVVDVGGGVGAPRERDVAAHVEGVALVVIERRQAGGQGEIGETAGDGSAAFGNLVGVGEVELAAMGDAGRAESEFPSADHCLGNGDGEEEIGLADIVVIEEIHYVGAEVVGVEYPAMVWDG